MIYKNRTHHLKNFHIALAVGLVITFLFSTISFAKTCDSIRDEVLRLHILANSDSEKDQAVKLKVRDALLIEGKNLFLDCKSKEDALQQLSYNREHLEKLANQTLKENGMPYVAKIKIQKDFFNTKSYDDSATLPAGEYMAVRVLLGEAKGHNWWCVMFPPMCLPAATDSTQLEEILSENEMNLVEKNPKFDIRFKIIEVFEKLFRKTE